MGFRGTRVSQQVNQEFALVFIVQNISKQINHTQYRIYSVESECPGGTAVRKVQ